VLAAFPSHLGIRVTQQLRGQPGPAAGHVAAPGLGTARELVLSRGWQRCSREACAAPKAQKSQRLLKAADN